MTNKLKHFYQTIILLIILHPIITWAMFFIMLFFIRIYCYNILDFNYSLNIKDNTFNYNLPKINLITNYFKYKIDFTQKYHILTLHNNKNKLNIYELMMITKITKEYTPDSNYTSYIPSSDIENSIMQTNIEDYVSTAVNIPKYPRFDENELFVTKPTLFYVVKEDIEKTIVVAGPIITNDIGFEAPTEIKVDEILELTSYDDLHYSIMQPSYNGKKLYSDNEIDQMHLVIIQIMKDKLNNYNNINYFSNESKEIIRQNVKEYMIKCNLFNNLNYNSLTNTNFIINLLIYEIIINYIFLDDLEKFIALNICGALIVESICYIQQQNVPDFYHDKNGCDMVIHNILQRFISAEFEEILLLDKDSTKYDSLNFTTFDDN